MIITLETIPFLGRYVSKVRSPWRLGGYLLLCSAVAVWPLHLLAQQAQTEILYLRGFGLFLPFIAITLPMNLFLCVWLAKAFEDDLTTMGLGEVKDKLQLKPFHTFMWVLVMNLFYQAMYAWLDVATNKELDSFEVRNRWLLSSHWLHLSVAFFLVPLWATISAITLNVLYVQQRLLKQHVHEVAISWQNFEPVEAVSNQAVRLIMMLLVMTSLLSLGLLMTQIPGYEMLEGVSKAVTTMVILMWLVMLPLMLPFVPPIINMHQRIKAYKRNEIDRVIARLESRYSDDKPFAQIPGETADAMAYIALIETRSEWPIGPDLRRAMLVGIVIPATWVFSAIIENAMY